jgi:hypothetical protein
VLTGTDGYLFFQSKSTGKCLESSFSGEVFSNECNKRYIQEWKIINTNSIQDEGYLIQNKATNKCLTLSGDSVGFAAAHFSVVYHWTLVRTNDCSSNSMGNLDW